MGGGTGLPLLLHGLKTRLFPAGWEWIPARDRNRDVEFLKALGCRPVECDLLGVDRDVRHDPLKLANAVLKIWEEAKTNGHGIG
ncbi:MAG: hypothetical protein HY695_20325 [Deltaproteobacteria bacterium]|nr:hypothetical protein [Deltaproteobacteria bacterium]